MSDAERSEPDWARLQELGEEMAEIIAAGKWTKTEYARLMTEAKKATHGYDEFLEFIENHGFQFDS